MTRPAIVSVFLSAFACASLAAAPAPAPLPGPPSVDAAAAERFASLALACVHKEYPNKIAHTLNGDADVKPPRQLTPAFYGCYDWHSAVHGHWLLARLARRFPDAPFAARARAALEQSLTPEHMAAEVAYLQAPGRTSFERPYGLAWLLQLAAELREWDDPQARPLAGQLRGLSGHRPGALTQAADGLSRLRTTWSSRARSFALMRRNSTPTS